LDGLPAAGFTLDGCIAAHDRCTLLCTSIGAGLAAGVFVVA
jgi:hypothetical protein